MARPNPSEQKLQSSIDKSESVRTSPSGRGRPQRGVSGGPGGRNARGGGGRGGPGGRRSFRGHGDQESAAEIAATKRELPELTPVKLDVKADATTMQDLFEKQQKYFSIPKAGDVVNTIVVDRAANEVRLSVEGYGTGVVRGRELFDELDEYSKLDPGQKIEASVIELENENGEIELSFRVAGRERVWKNILEKLASSEILQVKILDANKGGLIVVYQGVQGFVPVSQLTSEHYPRVEDGDRQRILERLQSYVGQTFSLKILDADPAEEKLIFSEKAAQLEQKKDLLDLLKVGDVIEGTITGIVDFGAFVQFDDMEGLVHISEMAWQRIDDPREILKVGQTVKAQIIGVDGARISLSMKKLIRDPWLDAVKKFSIGQTVEGNITKVTPFGAFVQLDNDIHGLVHISELSLKQIKDPSEIIEVGDKKEFKILSIEPSDHRLGLSLKAVEAEKAGIKLETSEPTKKISLEEMEKMADAKKEKSSTEPKKDTAAKKDDVVIPEVMGERSERAMLDEKKHAARKKEIASKKKSKK